MKAAVYFGVHDVKVCDFQEPPLGDGCVKIAVHYCGLCGTDVHKYNGQGGSRPVIPPVVLGHEASGIVVELGEHVRDLKVGDRVTVDPNWSCGGCYFCQNGMTHMCENSRGVVKGFAEYICPPQENVYKIPDSLSLKHAALAEPLSCCLNGMDLLDVKLGDTVLIVGMGSIGTMMLQLCKLASAANIIVVEPVKEKEALAKQLGATLFIDPINEDVNQVIKDAGIKNVDKVMECVGLKATIEQSLEYAGKCATVMLFGLGDPNKPAAFNQYAAFQKELTIRASFVNPHTTSRAVQLLSSGALDCEAVFSKEMEMEEIVAELKDLTYFRQGKVIVKVKEEK